MDKVKVNITIDDAHLEQIDQVTEALKSAGLEVEQTLSTLGIVTGSIASDKLSSLSEVAGVDSVESDKPIQLSPPDSDVQ
ncbi:ketohydroxyglutarate aldolase [Leptothoe spongobia TAU-MAC 1115]|uniref:Ketohydroxyglutarate aldolase n=2 Tax=Leptothoe TaxID=2651725 RepID=A0A947DJ32_9CYAN|nr:ketohydroxyglutarate aldolase [Leptothoe spongobia TAU-MAC 1115]